MDPNNENRGSAMFPAGLKCFRVSDDANNCDHWVTAFSPEQAANLAKVSDPSHAEEAFAQARNVRIPDHPKGYVVEDAHMEASTPRVLATIAR